MSYLRNTHKLMSGSGRMKYQIKEQTHFEIDNKFTRIIFDLI